MLAVPPNSPAQTPESFSVQTSRARNEGLSRQHGVLSRSSAPRANPSHSNRPSAPGKLPTIENLIFPGAETVTATTQQQRSRFGDHPGTSQEWKALPLHDVVDGPQRSVIAQPQQNRYLPEKMAKQAGTLSTDLTGPAPARVSALKFDVSNESYDCDTCPYTTTDTTNLATPACEERCTNSQYVPIQIRCPS